MVNLQGIRLVRRASVLLHIRLGFALSLGLERRIYSLCMKLRSRRLSHRIRLSPEVALTDCW